MLTNSAEGPMQKPRGIHHKKTMEVICPHV